jgi:hypothetical protein
VVHIFDNYFDFIHHRYSDFFQHGILWKGIDRHKSINDKKEIFVRKFCIRFVIDSACYYFSSFFFFQCSESFNFYKDHKNFGLFWKVLWNGSDEKVRNGHSDLKISKLIIIFAIRIPHFGLYSFALIIRQIMENKLARILWPYSFRCKLVYYLFERLLLVDNYHEHSKI